MNVIGFVLMVLVTLTAIVGFFGVLFGLALGSVQLAAIGMSCLVVMLVADKVAELI